MNLGNNDEKVILYDNTVYVCHITVVVVNVPSTIFNNQCNSNDYRLSLHMSSTLDLQDINDTLGLLLFTHAELSDV